jgi:hypothetical protein
MASKDSNKDGNARELATIKQIQETLDSRLETHEQRVPPVKADRASMEGSLARMESASRRKLCDMIYQETLITISPTLLDYSELSVLTCRGSL